MRFVVGGVFWPLLASFLLIPAVAARDSVADATNLQRKRQTQANTDKIIGIVSDGAFCFELIRQKPARKPRQSGAELAAAQRYFSRLSADGTMPENAVLRAISERQAMVASIGNGGIGAQGGGIQSWTWIGPGNIGGRLRAILIDPANSNNIWLGTAGGGIWKTTNGGTSWSPVDDFLPALSIGCMAMDPTNSSVMYTGSGEHFFATTEGTSNTAAMRGAGIFKSTDQGATWQQLPSTANSDFYFVNRIAIDPNNGQNVLAATNTGLFLSTDGGQSWIKKITGRVLDAQWHPTDSLKAVAGRDNGIAIYTTDGGQSWGTASGLSGTRVELRYAQSSPATVFACVTQNSRLKVYRSTDGGQTYTARYTGTGISTYSVYNNVIWVDPTNPNVVIVGGVYLYRSSDGGATFSGTFSSVHADMHAIVSKPGFDGVNNRTIYIGCDGGVYRADNAYGASAVALNNGLGVTQFYGAAVNPISGRVLAGAQDNGTSVYTGSTNWTYNVIGGDGGFCATDPADQNYFYGEWQFLHLQRSSNGGTSFSSISSGISDVSTSKTNFIPYFMLDPNNSSRMLACGASLWRTNNVKTGAPTWTAIKPALPGPEFKLKAWGIPQNHFADNDPRFISTVAVAKGNSDIIWCGHNNGNLYYTTNGTAGSPFWTQVDQNGLPDRWISRIAIEPTDHSVVYVSFLGYESDNLYRTKDAGQTWENITGSGLTKLPQIPISCVTLHPSRKGWLYVGTDLGVFTSMDDGATWTTSNDGPANTSVEELIWKNDTTLMAVTHGRGCFVAAVNVSVENYVPNEAITLRGTFNSGTIGSLAADDDDYWVQGAQYDPTDPLAVINSLLQASTNVAGAAYASGQVTVIQKSNSTLTKYRLRAIRADGGLVILADNIPGGFTETSTQVSLPNPVSEFIDAGSGNKMSLEIRNASSNRLAGFFRHSVELVGWSLTP